MKRKNTLNYRAAILFLKNVDHFLSPLSQMTHETLLFHLATMTPPNQCFIQKAPPPGVKKPRYRGYF